METLIFPVVRFKNLGVHLGLSFSFIPYIWLNPLPILMNLLSNIIAISHLLHGHYPGPSHHHLSPELLQSSSNKFLCFRSYRLCHLVGCCLSATNTLSFTVFCDVGTRTKHVFPLPPGSLWGFPIGGIRQRLAEEEGGLSASYWHPVGFLSLYGSYGITLATVPFHSSSSIQLAVFSNTFKTVNTQMRNSYSSSNLAFVKPQQPNLSNKACCKY